MTNLEGSYVRRGAAWISVRPEARSSRFRQVYGQSIGDYVRRRRLEHAARLLCSTEATAAAIAVECGFADQSHLTRLFRRRFGVTPSAYRRSRQDRDGDPT
jgi:AraC-like DNA-binding protein